MLVCSPVHVSPLLTVPISIQILLISLRTNNTIEAVVAVKGRELERLLPEVEEENLLRNSHVFLYRFSSPRNLSSPMQSQSSMVQLSDFSLKSVFFQDALTTSGMVESILTNKSDAYHRVIERLCSGAITHTIHELLRDVEPLPSTGYFLETFGDHTVPVLLLFIPAVLLRANTQLTPSQGGLVTTPAEWQSISSFVSVVYHKLLASPGRRAASITSLPPPPLAARHVPSWANILCGDEGVREALMVRSSSGDFCATDFTFGVENYGTVLCVIVCGLSHVMSLILRSSTVANSPGVSVLCKAVVELLSSPTAVFYVSKNQILQTASGSLLLSVRSALSITKSGNEVLWKAVRQPMWAALHCVFDLAILSCNTTCIQLLFPYLIGSAPASCNA
uniref:Uncharacterized protein n=1 Tax=Trypanosoma congolense (strain IL3000) TaxID=1068625 RepID=G0UZW9_TRYCI|nr:conserved hypothetical protein [Trypanosoma congolense IL3000]